MDKQTAVDGNEFDAFYLDYQARVGRVKEILAILDKRLNGTEGDAEKGRSLLTDGVAALHGFTALCEKLEEVSQNIRCCDDKIDILLEGIKQA